MTDEQQKNWHFVVEQWAKDTITAGKMAPMAGASPQRVAWAESVIAADRELIALRAEVAIWRSSPACRLCGGPMSHNPHVRAGMLPTLLEVGATWVCIPCTKKALSTATKRAHALEAVAEAAETYLERGWFNASRGMELRRSLGVVLTAAGYGPAGPEPAEYPPCAADTTRTEARAILTALVVKP